MSKENEFTSKVEDFVSENVDKAFNRLNDFVESSETSDQIKKLVKETNEFVQKNPWTAVVGAVVIGYVLGSLSRRHQK